MLFTLRILFHFGTFLDGLPKDVEFNGEEGGEEHYEDEEGQHHTAGTYVAHTHPGGQHILDSPGLASELSHQSSALTGHIAQGQHRHGCEVEPTELADITFVDQEEHHDEEKDEKRS